MKHLIFSCFLVIGLLATKDIASAATVSISAPREAAVGQTFQVTFFVQQADKVDTVRLKGDFSREYIDLLSMATTDQLESRSPSTYFLQQNGEFSYGAFSLDDPKTGGLKAGTFTFKALKPGIATVSLQNGSLVLSSGTNQLQNLPKATIIIKESDTTVREASTSTSFVVTSETHPIESRWYNAATIQLGWDIQGESIKDLYFGFDDIPEGVAELVVPRKGSKSIEAPKNGIWYAHFVAILQDGTKRRRDFRVQVDTETPRAFGLSVDYLQLLPQTANFLRFSAVDSVSGIAMYEVYDGGEFIATTTQPFYDITRMVGDREFTVIARDLAGNVQQASLAITIRSLTGEADVSSYNWRWWLLILFVIIAGAGMLLGYALHSHEDFRTYFVHRLQQKRKKK